MSETPESSPQCAAGVDPSAMDADGPPEHAAADMIPPPAPTEPRPSPGQLKTGIRPTPLSPQQLGAGAGQIAARQFPDPSKVNGGWWVFAILLLAGTVVWCVVVAEGTAFSHAHRLAAGAVALLDVVALATLTHVILLWYQSKIASGSLIDADQETLNFRRRGLKAAVIGQDGRASTSKAQAVLWTGAVIWALTDLLLLARAYPSRNLFTASVTSNWRPEYLVLLGLPVAAAVTAKAVVSASNGGRGPVASSGLAAAPDQHVRVYVRDPVQSGVKGLTIGLSELITADDGTVVWADLQYVAFTLVTLVYFVAQLLAQPQHGLPPVPAALLTLMGVSASGYTASKIIETKGQ